MSHCYNSYKPDSHALYSVVLASGVVARQRLARADGMVVAVVIGRREAKDGQTARLGKGAVARKELLDGEFVSLDPNPLGTLYIVKQHQTAVGS